MSVCSRACDTIGPMRIVHVTDCFLPMMGGIETQVSQLAAQQAQRGDQVTVLTCTPGEVELPYRVLRSVWANPVHAPVDPRAPRRFHQVLERLNPDVVHLHLGELTPVVQALLWRLRNAHIPTLVTVHSVWNRRVTLPIYRWLGKSFRDAHIGWTGVSHLVAGLVAEAVGAENVQVLPNGVDGSRWRVEPEPHEGLVAVTAARFAPRKRIPALLEILREAAGEVEPGSLRAVLAGEGPGFESAQSFVERHGLEDVISLPGRLSAPELRRLYAGADVFVSPSINEAASIAAAEAQAAGLAILTRSQSGLGERIGPDEGVRAQTDAELTQTLVEWTRQPAQLQAIREHNRGTVCPLDWQVVMPQVDSAYKWAQERAGRNLPQAAE